MPRKPKRPCSHPGCPNLTDGRYCDEHQKLEDKRYEKYDRDKEAKKWYGRAWQKIRDSYITEHPYCEECYKNNIMKRAAHVHHKFAFRDGGTHNRDNLIALCKSCHSKIHAEMGERWN